MFTNVIRKHYQNTTSTQDIAKELVTSLDSKSCFMVTADEQTKGRGTHGRTWFSPPNVNLYVTYVFPFPDSKLSLLFNIPQVIAYSVLQTLNEYGLDAKFKWINDILLNNKKVSGILCESTNLMHLAGYNAVFVGIGININLAKNACGSLDQPITSLMLELGRLIDKDEVLNKLTSHISNNMAKLLQEGFDPFFNVISTKMAFIGEMIKVQLDDKDHTIKEGILVGIDSQGMLLLNTNNKVEKLFTGRIIRSQTQIQPEVNKPESLLPLTPTILWGYSKYAAVGVSAVAVGLGLYLINKYKQK